MEFTHATNSSMTTFDMKLEVFCHFFTLFWTITRDFYLQLFADIADSISRLVFVITLTGCGTHMMYTFILIVLVKLVPWLSRLLFTEEQRSEMSQRVCIKLHDLYEWVYKKYHKIVYHIYSAETLQRLEELMYMLETGRINFYAPCAPRKVLENTIVYACLPLIFKDETDDPDGRKTELILQTTNKYGLYDVDSGRVPWDFKRMQPPLSVCIAGLLYCFPSMHIGVMPKDGLSEFYHEMVILLTDLVSQNKYERGSRLQADENEKRIFIAHRTDYSSLHILENTPLIPPDVEIVIFFTDREIVTKKINEKLVTHSMPQAFRKRVMS